MTRNNCSCSDSIEAGLLRIVHTLPPCSLKAPKSPRTDGSVVAWGSPRCGGDAGAVQSNCGKCVPWWQRTALLRPCAAWLHQSGARWEVFIEVLKRVCVYTASHMPFWKCWNVINMQGGQAYHTQPGPTKLGCDRGSTKGRFDMYLHR